MCESPDTHTVARKVPDLHVNGHLVAKLSPLLALLLKLALALLLPSLELLQHREEWDEHLQQLLLAPLLVQQHMATTWRSSEYLMPPFY